MNEKPSSKTAGDCDSIQDLIPAYAFGITDPEENQLVEANLDGCGDASTELAEYRQLQDEMRASVPQIDPPLMLMGRLAAATASPHAVAVVPKPHHRRTLLPWAAAIAALIALVLTNVFWLSRVNTLTREENEYLSNDTDHGADGQFVLSSTRDLRWVRLQPAQQDDKASAFLCWNAESQTGLLYVWGFPSAAPGKSYQLWLTRGDTRTNAGTFRVDESGRTVILFHSDEPIDKYTWARITADASSANPQPDTNIVVNGEL